MKTALYIVTTLLSLFLLISQRALAKPPANPGYGILALGPDGYYWGTRELGGTKGGGMIFKVKADGSDWQPVLSFTGDDAINKGSSPMPGLASDGNGFLWGTTLTGGVNGRGTIFKVNASSGLLTTVVEFTDNGASNKGRDINGGLIDDGRGFFWGTTQRGGEKYYGTVFKVDARNGLLTTVVEFTSNKEKNKGGYPYAGLVSDGAGSVWGTTRFGGEKNVGTVFKVNMNSGALTTIAEFTDDKANGGYSPCASLVNDGSGSIWGTTNQGGANGCGTVFKVNASSGALTTVIVFTGNGGSNKGQYPYGELVSDGAGSFWGTTQFGGANGCGTVFKVNSRSGLLTTVVEFTGKDGSNKGRNPTAGLSSDGAGSFWGMTNEGGENDNGTVFKVNATTGALTTVKEFIWKHK
jgi:uncharacterized repeat protein (TIGR03803 family)